MNQKERFVNTLKFKPVDRVPFMEIGLWGQTLERWISEGAPANLDPMFMLGNDYFNLEGYEITAIDGISPRPPYEDKVIEEKDDHILFQDGLGRTRMARKSGTVRGTRMSMDHYTAFAVKDRATFLDMRRRYQGDPMERYPKDWAATVKKLKSLDRPVTLLNPMAGTFGYYSMLRNWIGTEALSYLFYDEPELIHECLDCLSDFALKLLERAVKDVKFDFYFVHEDMAGKGGPLMGPDLFRKFLLPHYKRFVGFLKSHGVEMVLVDTDGDFESLIPVFLEAGVDGFGPMEVASNMDPVRMRKKYGKSFSMLGGVDKREIAKGKAAIDAQLAHLAPLIPEGGYIPMIDHAIHPDISLADFRYYLDRKREIIFGNK